MELLPYPGYCMGQFVSPCMKAVDGDVYEYIEGYQFEWGYRTVLTIRTRHIHNPPADGSSIEYDLVDVESRKPVEPGTRFDLVLTPTLEPEQFASIVAGDCTTGFELFPHSFQAKPFSFEAGIACESFEQRIAATVPSQLSFAFDRPEKPLKLVAFE